MALVRLPFQFAVLATKARRASLGSSKAAVGVSSVLIWVQVPDPSL